LGRRFKRQDSRVQSKRARAETQGRRDKDVWKKSGKEEEDGRSQIRGRGEILNSKF
jgi:hypothetical protein